MTEKMRYHCSFRMDGYGCCTHVDAALYKKVGHWFSGSTKSTIHWSNISPIG